MVFGATDQTRRAVSGGDGVPGRPRPQVRGLPDVYRAIYRRFQYVIEYITDKYLTCVFLHMIRKNSRKYQK